MCLFSERIDLHTAAYFRELVSGRRTGPVASLLRGVLRLGEFPYLWVVKRRNRDFDTGRRLIYRVAAPVISVGNLTLGGTGKTPMVEWLARWLLNRGLRIAIISRGYKSEAKSQNDEARELAQKLPGVVQLQNPDRVTAAQMAVDQFDSQMIILDDAFQHRRIARDLNIVLLDALEPFGFGHVFPRGTLREPLAGLARANIAVLTRADIVDEVERARIHGIVQSHAPQIAWAECRHSPQCLLSAKGLEEPLGTLRGRRIAAFCGIGNPAGFRHTLDRLGYQVVAWREFPDHFAFGPAHIDELARWAKSHSADALVCTHKDLVKLDRSEIEDIPLQAIRIGLEFLRGQDVLESALDKLVLDRR